jgi:hypothetical protein
VLKVRAKSKQQTLYLALELMINESFSWPQQSIDTKNKVNVTEMVFYVYKAFHNEPFSIVEDTKRYSPRGRIDKARLRLKEKYT